MNFPQLSKFNKQMYSIAARGDSDKDFLNISMLKLIINRLHVEV